ITQYGRLLKLPAVIRDYPALGRQAQKEGWPYEDFLRELLEAEVRSRNERTVARRLKEARFPDLKTLEHLDWDAQPGVQSTNLLAERYERRSTLVTSNLAFGEWVQVFGDEKLTTALLDRLSHHAHILTTKGMSYRTRKRTVAS